MSILHPLKNGLFCLLLTGTTREIGQSLRTEIGGPIPCFLQLCSTSALSWRVIKNHINNDHTGVPKYTTMFMPFEGAHSASGSPAISHSPSRHSLFYRHPQLTHKTNSPSALHPNKLLGQTIQAFAFAKVPIQGAPPCPLQSHQQDTAHPPMLHHSHKSHSLAPHLHSQPRMEVYTVPP